MFFSKTFTGLSHPDVNSGALMNVSFDLVLFWVDSLRITTEYLGPTASAKVPMLLLSYTIDSQDASQNAHYRVGVMDDTTSDVMLLKLLESKDKTLAHILWYYGNNMSRKGTRRQSLVIDRHKLQNKRNFLSVNKCREILREYALEYDDGFLYGESKLYRDIPRDTIGMLVEKLETT